MGQQLASRLKLLEVGADLSVHWGRSRVCKLKACDAGAGMEGTYGISGEENRLLQVVGVLPSELGMCWRADMGNWCNR